MSHRLEDIQKLVDAIPPETPVKTVIAMFQGDPSLEAIAVVLDETPIGLVSREQVQALMIDAPSQESLFGISVTKVMDSDPVCADAKLNVGFFGHQCLTGAVDPKAFRTGAIVTHGGYYSGLVEPGAFARALARLSVHQTHFIQKQKARLAAQSDTAKTSLDLQRQKMAMLAHEIRTPIGGITGLADLLMDMGLPSKATKLAQSIVDAGENLDTLVSDMIDFAAIEAGHLSITPQLVDLNQLAKDLRQAWSAHPATRDLDFNIILAPRSVSRIEADPVRLLQIAGNLISNALKFTRSGSVLTILEATPISNDDVELTITVKDTGSGISKDVREEVKQPWQQGALGEEDRKTGSGLGLAIVQGLADQLGGRLELRENPGGGTQAIASIRAKSKSIRLAAERSSSKPRKPRANMELGRILVADDHGLSRYIIEQALTEAGWNLDIVHNGAQALRRAEANTYQAILVDIHMPEMNGDDVMAAVQRGSGPNVQSPFIAMSADISRDLRNKCLDGGFACFLPKPIRPRRLVTDLIDVIVAPRERSVQSVIQRFGEAKAS